MLHLGEDGADVAGPDLRQFEPADDRHDLPADVALVPVQGARADPPSPLVLEPAMEVVGQADPLRAGVSSSFDVPDELVQGALRLPPRGEAAFALLATSAGDRVGPDVDDELPRAALTDVSSHGGLLLRLDGRTIGPKGRGAEGRRISHPLSAPGPAETDPSLRRRPP